MDLPTRALAGTCFYLLPGRPPRRAFCTGERNQSRGNNIDECAQSRRQGARREGQSTQ